MHHRRPLLLVFDRVLVRRTHQVRNVTTVDGVERGRYLLSMLLWCFVVLLLVVVLLNACQVCGSQTVLPKVARGHFVHATQIATPDRFRGCNVKERFGQWRMLMMMLLLMLLCMW